MKDQQELLKGKIGTGNDDSYYTCCFIFQSQGMKIEGRTLQTSDMDFAPFNFRHRKRIF